MVGAYKKKWKTKVVPLLSGAQILDLAGHLGYLIFQTLRGREERWLVYKKKHEGISQ